MKLAGENRQLGEKPVSVPLCPPQISHGLDLGSNPGLRGERPATNRLSRGTAWGFALSTDPIWGRGKRKSRAIHLHSPSLAFMYCSRVKFTFTFAFNFLDEITFTFVP
jgi:hypothetical protein